MEFPQVQSCSECGGLFVMPRVNTADSDLNPLAARTAWAVRGQRICLACYRLLNNPLAPR